MGRYMRKCKGVGEVAVMEVSQVGGVRTRARALAALKGRSSGPAVVGELQVSYLELRSRRLIKSAPARGKFVDLAARVPVPTERAVNSRGSAGCEAEARTSSNCLSVEDAAGAGRCCDVSDLEVEVSLGESAVDNECSESIREAAASSNLGEESEALESTTSPAVNNYGVLQSRKASKQAAPSESEIEEFFAAFEKEEQRRFTEKYNYDPVKDVPLTGRYDWVKLTP